MKYQQIFDVSLAVASSYLRHYLEVEFTNELSISFIGASALINLLTNSNHKHKTNHQQGGCAIYSFLCANVYGSVG